MKSLSQRCLALAVAAGVAVPTSVFATNGYMAIGYGNAALGMGGASIAFPQDALAAASNPAGMSEVGTRIDAGIALFHPPRRVAGENGQYNFQTPLKDSTTPGTATSGSNEFLIPSMGGNFQFNRKITVGMSVVGNGANTRYNRNFFSLTGLPAGQTYGTLGVQLIQVQMLPTVTYKVNKDHAIGVSLVMGVQTFRAYGLGNFAQPTFQFTSPDGVSHLTNKGNDWSYGAGIRVGWLGHFFDDRLSLGAAIGSKVYMTRFKKYSGLFAQDGAFDIPENFAIGIAIKPTKKITLAADVQRILYSRVPSVGNTHPTTDINDLCTRPVSATNCSTPGNTPQGTDRQLGGPNGFGFGWRDQTAYKLGVAYALNDRWTLRTGLNYGKSPIPDNQLLFNLLAPAITERFATLGFTYGISQNSDFSASWVHAFTHSQVCAVNDGCTTMLTQKAGAYVAAQMHYDAVGVGYTMKF